MTTWRICLSRGGEECLENVGNRATREPIALPRKVMVVSNRRQPGPNDLIPKGDAERDIHRNRQRIFCHEKIKGVPADEFPDRSPQIMDDRGDLLPEFP